MQTEQTIFDQCITPILRVVQDNAQYPGQDAKWAVIAPASVQGGCVGEARLRQSEQAQSEYCKHHKFEPR